MESEGRPRPRQVVFVGIDGATWDYMDGLVTQGKLPNIARMKREGVGGTLRSVQSYVSPPAWTTMLTGYLPENSGVYTFGAFDRETKQFGGIRSGDALVPFIWEAAGRAGLKSAVINVPMTYPVYPINGIMVSGLLTPIDVGGVMPMRPASGAGLDALFQRAKSDARSLVSTDASEPWAAAVEDDLNLFVIQVHDTRDDGRVEYDTVTLHAFIKDDNGDVTGEPMAYTFGLSGYSPWVALQVRVGGEHKTAFTRMKLVPDEVEAGITLSETVFPIEATFTYPESLAAELLDQFGFYLPTKMMSKAIVPTLTRDNTAYASFFYDYDDWDLFCFVFTQSDNVQHKAGYGAETEAVYVEIDRFLGEMMERMPGDAVLIVGSDHGFGEYDRGVDLNRYFERLKLLEWKGRGIDHEKTLVFHNLWHLYINHELVTRDELAARGIAVPASADPVEFLKQYVIDACRDISVRDRAYPVHVEAMPANALGEAPDMRITGSYNGYMVEYWAVQKPQRKIVYKRGGEDRFWHARDGVFLMWGDGIVAGVDGGAVGIECIAPTMSYLLGLPVSAAMEGHALTEFFDPGYVSRRPLLVTRGYRDIPREGVAVDDEREELEKKLKSLGYIK